MRYIVTVNGERIAVSRDGAEFAVGDDQMRADLEEIEGTPVRLVKIGDEVHRVVMQKQRGRGAYVLWIDGHRYEVEALDERARAIRDLSATTAAAAGPAPLIAPMPGLIVRIKVVVGDMVQAGQGLVIMEAMKMENELRARAGGRVRLIAAEEGIAVEKGAVLVELE
ncbi:MAG: acetyl-CoA carboxylase biotin carboxyl carrier protein subunit [Gemmatimonadaceae bacterium]